MKFDVKVTAAIRFGRRRATRFVGSVANPEWSAITIPPINIQPSHTC